MKKNVQVCFRFFAVMAPILMLICSCSDENMPNKNPEDINTSACKNKPGQISYGRDTSKIVYNTQDKPIEITTKEYNIAAPAEPPVTAIYTIDYNAQGNVAKISKTIDNQLKLYYQMEYNSGGKLIKQSNFNAQGILVAYTVTQYDANSILKSITTHNENTSVEVTSIYQYMDGNLIKKSIQNLYDFDSQEYYNADYTYTYFLDRENKIKPYFEGPLGLIFVSNLSNEQSLQYLPNRSHYQLFFAQETSYEKKMLKKIEIVAHRYSTRDTTNIDYLYEYDSDGFPTMQRGSYENIKRRYVPTPFGGSVFLVTPTDNSFESSMSFSCK
ncbi:hypothetical protein [Flavobacterium sp.]|uniref:hypothetical protein n=1 Tax=Flavobacterium sp. TaxID=239 RepID=UPI0032673693